MSRMKNQLLIYSDPDRCIKCYACQVACKQWHGISAGGAARRRVIEQTSGTFPNVTRVFYSLACMHCADPECVRVCPAGALTKRDADGIVAVDRDLCIGCHYCSFACPYDVPAYDDGGLVKCDMCLSLGVGEDGRPNPHCVATCPTQALYFGTREEIEHTLSDKETRKREANRAPLTGFSHGR